MNQDELTELYCAIANFWESFKNDWEKHLIGSGKSKRGPESILSVPEMMTIVVLFHQANYRTFKHFYCGYVQKFLKSAFPKLISYERFVVLMKNLFIPLFAFAIQSRGRLTGISFVDSTKIEVCHKKRINRNKVFFRLAKKGKASSGWFYGFKLHLIINELGEILAFQLTPGNISDIKMLEPMSKGIFGKIFGDKGYISADLTKKLLKRGVQLFTTLRKNMKNKVMPIKDKLLLRKRVIIETVNDQLKNISQIEHTRHRSPSNFLVNMLASLIAYIRQPKKPRIKMNALEEKALLLRS